MINERTDSELIAATLVGDLKCYSELVRRYEGNVRACLSVRLQNSYEAEDLAQEAFIVAYKKLEDFDQNKPFGPWVRTIALNLLRNYMRKHKPIFMGDMAALDDLVQGKLEGGAFLQDEDERLEALKGCIKKLTGSMKELITLRYLEDRSVKELTEKYDSSHSTITMRLHRIREKLHKCVVSNIS